MTDEMNAKERKRYNQLARQLATHKGAIKPIRAEMKKLAHTAYMRWYRKDK